MKLYGDLGKVARKLLSDDYVSGTSVKLEATTSDGVTYIVSGKQGTKDDTITGELTSKVFYKGATFTGKLNTSLEPTAEVQYKRKDNDINSKVTLKGGDKVANLNTEITLPRAGINIVTDAINKRGSASVAFAVAPTRYEWFAVLGAHSSFAKGESSISTTMSYAASLYDGRESEISAEVEPAAKVGTLSYSHLVRPGLSVAGKMKYARESGDVSAQMGLAMKLDGATTIKAKVNSEGQAGLSYIQEVRPKTKVIMSSAFDVAKFDTAKVGLSVTIE